jgi:hypothetical protein
MRPRKYHPSFLRRAFALVLTAALLAVDVRGVTLLELLTDPRLDAKRFAAKFEGFKYEFAPEVQKADVFLSREVGDCDDYAILADYVLKRKGFATRIIHVRLVGRVAHAVCYVTEAKGILDFNNRRYIANVERCGRSLREIATEVAAGFKANWTSVSEFTYDYSAGKKTFARTVLKTDPPAQDVDAGDK